MHRVSCFILVLTVRNDNDSSGSKNVHSIKSYHIIVVIVGNVMVSRTENIHYAKPSII